MTANLKDNSSKQNQTGISEDILGDKRETIQEHKHGRWKPPINPTPCPYFRVSWIRTLLYPGSCGRWQQLWRTCPDEVCYDTCWLTGFWSSQAKVEGIVLKAAWHWGRDCSVVNNPLVEPGRNPLYVGLLSTWGSMDCDQIFSLICTLAPNWGLWHINEWINHCLWRWSFSLHRDPVGEHVGGLIYRDFEAKV